MLSFSETFGKLCSLMKNIFDSELLGLRFESLIGFWGCLGLEPSICIFFKEEIKVKGLFTKLGQGVGKLPGIVGYLRATPHRALFLALCLKRWEEEEVARLRRRGHLIASGSHHLVVTTACDWRESILRLLFPLTAWWSSPLAKPDRNLQEEPSE